MNTATTVWCETQGLTLCFDHLPAAARKAIEARPDADVVDSSSARWYREQVDDLMFCEVCPS